MFVSLEKIQMLELCIVPLRLDQPTLLYVDHLTEAIWRHIRHIQHIQPTQCTSLRTEQYSHMLSCRTKLAMLLCLKYFGRTSLAKRPWSKTWKLVPDWKRLRCLKFSIISECHTVLQSIYLTMISRFISTQICLVSQLLLFYMANRIKTRVNDNKTCVLHVKSCASRLGSCCW